jgi:hypothetical protein
MSSPTILEGALRIHSVEARRPVRRISARTLLLSPPRSTRSTARARARRPLRRKPTRPTREIDVCSLSGASFGLEAAQEAFDEPLDRGDVVAIVQPFFIPNIF